MIRKAKLVITDLSWNAGDQPKPGTPITFSVTVKNEGPEILLSDAKQSVITIFINRDTLPQIKFNETFAVGESRVFESVVWEAIPGNHVITAALDFTLPSPNNYGTGLYVTKNIRVAEEALPVPAVAAAAGMNTLTFSDDFTTLSTIDVQATGKFGYKWHPTRPYDMTTLEPTDYEITENGLLLKEEQSTHNCGLSMLDVDSGAGWGYTHGYMEAKFRMPAVRLTEGKGGPAIWSLPTTRLWLWCNEWVEVDFMEYWGNTFAEDLLYTVSLHHMKDDCDFHTNNRVDNHKTSHHYGMGDGDWHVMGWLWEEGSFTTYVDGEKVMVQTWSKDGVPEPPARLFTGEKLDGAYALLDSQEMPVIINGAKTWPLEIAYLNIWQA